MDIVSFPMYFWAPQPAGSSTVSACPFSFSGRSEVSAGLQAIAFAITGIMSKNGTLMRTPRDKRYTASLNWRGDVLRFAAVTLTVCLAAS